MKQHFVRIIASTCMVFMASCGTSDRSSLEKAAPVNQRSLVEGAGVGQRSGHLRFDGVYCTERKVLSKPGAKYYCAFVYLLRFYPDQTVLETSLMLKSAKENPTKNAINWFSTPNIVETVTVNLNPGQNYVQSTGGLSSGKCTKNGDKVRFTTTSRQGSVESNCTVSEGKIENHYHSWINGKVGSEVYYFTPF